MNYLQTTGGARSKANANDGFVECTVLTEQMIKKIV